MNQWQAVTKPSFITSETEVTCLYAVSDYRYSSTYTLLVCPQVKLRHQSKYHKLPATVWLCPEILFSSQYLPTCAFWIARNPLKVIPRNSPHRSELISRVLKLVFRLTYSLQLVGTWELVRFSLCRTKYLVSLPNYLHVWSDTWLWNLPPVFISCLHLSRISVHCNLKLTHAYLYLSLTSRSQTYLSWVESGVTNLSKLTFNWYSKAVYFVHWASRLVFN